MLTPKVQKYLIYARMKVSLLSLGFVNLNYSFPKASYLAVCTVACASLVSCNRSHSGGSKAMMMMMMQAAPVRAVAAVSQDVPLDVSAVGTVEAITSVDVKSRVAGQVLRVDFQEGQNVEKGQLLFEIDPEPLQRQIAQTQADIAKDVALERQARANVTKDEANIQQTSAAAKRGLELSREGIFSKEQTEQIVSTNEQAQAALAADQAAVESAVASNKSDNARLLQTQLQLEYTKITAPISGRAGAIMLKAGNLIKDNDAALVNIMQISPIYVSFGVPQQLLDDVSKFNQQHPLIVRATPDGENAVTGQLKFIDNTVDSSTGTIKLKAQFQNADRMLWPGQFVNVQTQLQVEHDRVTVPLQTIQTGPQGKYVWVMNKGTDTVQLRPVQVLRNYTPGKGGELAVIGNGLNAGDMVISEGQMRLAPGMKVRLLQPQTQLGQTGSDSASAHS
jgi:membrane fusion protein, multidrug efflux system